MAKTKDEIAKADAALFKQQREADKPVATEDYRSEQERQLANMQKLRRERVAREGVALAPKDQRKKKSKQRAD